MGKRYPAMSAYGEDRGEAWRIGRLRRAYEVMGAIAGMCWPADEGLADEIGEGWSDAVVSMRDHKGDLSVLYKSEEQSRSFHIVAQLAWQAVGESRHSVACAHAGSDEVSVATPPPKRERRRPWRDEGLSYFDWCIKRERERQAQRLARSPASVIEARSGEPLTGLDPTGESTARRETPILPSPTSKGDA